MRKTRWNLDLLAEKIYKTKFYKDHEDLKVDFYGLLSESIKKEQTPEVLLEQIKLLPGLYNHSKWPYRWGLHVPEQDYKAIKEKSQPEIINLFSGDRADMNVLLGYMWKTMPYDGLHEELWNTLYGRLQYIQRGLVSPKDLSCFDGITDQVVIDATIGRYFVSLYKVLAAYPRHARTGHEGVLLYTPNEKYRKADPKYCINYFVGHNRIVESAIAYHKKNPEIVLDLHRTTCDMTMQNLTENMVEFLLICYSILENVYGVKIE